MKFDWPPEKRINNENTVEPSWFDLHVLRGEEGGNKKTAYPRPFVRIFNNNQYGILKNDNLYLIDLGKNSEAQKLMAGYIQTIGGLDAYAIHSPGGIPYQLIAHQKQYLSEIDALLENSIKIRPEDISGVNTKENPEYFYNEFQDYLILLEESNIEKIEDFFGIRLAELSTREQFYFLNFIKSKNKSEVEKVREFVLKFGNVGLQTFLSIEYGGKEMGG